MIKTFSRAKDGNKFISEHFQIWEFGSYSNKYWYTDKIIIDTDVVDMIEKIFAHFGCKYAIITSGYRTPQHDLDVSGDGKGYHTLGMAVDIAFFDSNGKMIPSREICFYAQDMGVYGIGHGNGYTHLDTRPANKKWFGDEAKNYVATNDWYKYFGVKPTNVSIYYRVKQGGKWISAKKNSNTCGKANTNITDVAIKVNKGYIKYRVHIKGGDWLPYVTGYDIHDDNNGYAGIGKPIDKIEIISLSGNTIKILWSSRNTDKFTDKLVGEIDQIRVSIK